MIAAWMLYATLVGTLLGGGAFVVDRLLRVHGRPARGVWAGAMFLSALWPVGHRLWESLPRPAPAAPLPDLPPLVVPLRALELEVAPTSILHLLDRPLVVAWTLASLVLLLAFLHLLSRTRRMREGWEPGEAVGHPVLYSDECGPAVVGIRRPTVVLPAWCREMDERALRFILDHEIEHIRAGDLRLLLSAAPLLVLFPWHLPLWWQMGRLRLAMEADCDLRVLRRNPGPRRPYLELLLEVGERSSAVRPLALLLSEPFQTLKRRIAIMTMPIPRKPWARGLTLAAAGGALVAVACWAPGPTDLRREALAAETTAPQEVTPQSIVEVFATGFTEGVQKKDWARAMEEFGRGLRMGPDEAMRQQLDFWLGYSLFNNAVARQEPQTLESARTALPLFQEVIHRVSTTQGYAQRNNLESNRVQIISAARTYIEIQEAIIRRGR